MTTDPQAALLAAENEIAALKKQLTEAQRLTALGELVSTTTHEFNNILMTIINYSKIGMRHKDEPTRDKALQKIHTASQRAAKITNSVLGMARNRSDSYEPTDLSSIVEETMILLSRELNKYRISVEQEFKSVPLALANGNQIQQVLLNLVINARQAMLNGGRLILKIEHDQKNDMVDLVVRDFGPGMEPQKLHKIFEPFFSTKSGPDETGKGGTGLGLSACKDIIEAHGGRIRVESSVGKGTCFTIKLPVAAKKEAAIKGVAKTGAAKTQAAKTESEKTVGKKKGAAKLAPKRPTAELMKTVK